MTGLFSHMSLSILQSFLLKRSGNSLNKEWKKKYVTLSSNGFLLYHPSINVSGRDWLGHTGWPWTPFHLYQSVSLTKFTITSGEP